LAGAPPQIPLGELTALPKTPSCIKGGLLLREGKGGRGNGIEGKGNGGGEGVKGGRGRCKGREGKGKG